MNIKEMQDLAGITESKMEGYEKALAAVKAALANAEKVGVATGEMTAEDVKQDCASMISSRKG